MPAVCTAARRATATGAPRRLCGLPCTANERLATWGILWRTGAMRYVVLATLRLSHLSPGGFAGALAGGCTPGRHPLISRCSAGQGPALAPPRSREPPPRQLRVRYPQPMRLFHGSTDRHLHRAPCSAARSDRRRAVRIPLPAYAMRHPGVKQYETTVNNRTYVVARVSDSCNRSSCLRQSGISLLFWWCLPAAPANTTILIVNTMLPQALAEPGIRHRVSRINNRTRIALRLW